MTPILQSLHDLMTGDQWPQLRHAQQEDNRAELVLQVSEDLHWLQGHFPSQPVLAGVVQTDWACNIALQVFDIQQAPQRIDNLKFQNVILPPQIIKLELVRNTSTGAIHFRYSDPDVPGHSFSEGKLVF
jgi:3-hydroxymyristoyl/3-hydroxydecanoyl-(acyl carrier protein) dehydratase